MARNPIKAVGAFLLYLPPYSRLNPIGTIDEWQVIMDCLDQFPANNCRN